jgi:FKBP-type peptidyl-prolyl cis-trans isomerase
LRIAAAAVIAASAAALAACGGTAEPGSVPSSSTPAPEPASAEAATNPPAPPAASAPAEPAAFRRPDPAKAKSLPSGLKCEVIEEGSGAAPGPDDAFELEYSFWNEEGELIESSVGAGQNLQGKAAEMPLPFLKEAPALLREGGTAVFEVPSALGFGQRGGGKLKAGAPTIWRLRLVRLGKVVPVPAFVLPPESELTRTESGLGIKVLAEGSGVAPKMGENVVVHYAGWLKDGSPFDASYSRGFPSTFRLGEVIPGWNEGLQHLKPGGSAILVIPPDLGYGARGAGAKIPGGSTLVFRVELLEVKK